MGYLEHLSREVSRRHQKQTHPGQPEALQLGSVVTVEQRLLDVALIHLLIPRAIFSLTCEQDPETLELPHLRQGVSPDPETNFVTLSEGLCGIPYTLPPG